MSFEKPTLEAKKRSSWKELLIYSPAFLIVMAGSAVGFFCGAVGVAFGTSFLLVDVADSVYLSLAVIMSGGLVGATITGLALSAVSFGLTNFLVDRLNNRTTT